MFRLQRLLGMIKLNKFIHRLSELTAPLPNMIKKNTEFDESNKSVGAELLHQEFYQKLKKNIQ